MRPRSCHAFVSLGAFGSWDALVSCAASPDVKDAQERSFNVILKGRDLEGQRATEPPGGELGSGRLYEYLLHVLAVDFVWIHTYWRSRIRENDLSVCRVWRRN